MPSMGKQLDDICASITIIAASCESTDRRLATLETACQELRDSYDGSVRFMETRLASLEEKADILLERLSDTGLTMDRTRSEVSTQRIAPSGDIVTDVLIDAPGSLRCTSQSGAPCHIQEEDNTIDAVKMDLGGVPSETGMSQHAVCDSQPGDLALGDIVTQDFGSHHTTVPAIPEVLSQVLELRVEATEPSDEGPTTGIEASTQRPEKSVLASSVPSASTSTLETARTDSQQLDIREEIIQLREFLKSQLERHALNKDRILAIAEDCMLTRAHQNKLPRFIVAFFKSLADDDNLIWKISSSSDESLKLTPSLVSTVIGNFLDESGIADRVPRLSCMKDMVNSLDDYQAYAFVGSFVQYIPVELTHHLHAGGTMSFLNKKGIHIDSQGTSQSAHRWQWNNDWSWSWNGR